MFYSYTGSKHKKYTLQDIPQINTPISCCYLSKVLLQRRGSGYAKVIHEKKRKERRKNGQVSEISKTMGTQMPA
jgi:hypothetical protein